MSFACLPLVAAWSYNLGLGPTDYIRLRVYNIRVAPLRAMPLHDARCCAAPFASTRISSLRYISIEQCSIFCARPRDFAAARLRLQAKLGLFHCVRPKRTVDIFSPNQWAFLSFILFHFFHFFGCFSGENGSFVLQIVQFPRTWCSNHFVSDFEIQILNGSKFFNHFRGNSNLQKHKKKKKKEPQTKRGKNARSTNKATDEKRKTNAIFLFACQRHFVFFRTGTLVCCKFYGKRVVGLLGGLRDELRSHADRKIL